MNNILIMMQGAVINAFMHYAIQWKWFRKWRKGNYFKIQTALPMAPFWSDTIITSCQAKIIETEKY